MVTRSLLAVCVGGLALGLSACGGGSSSTATKPPDPTAMALQAPGIRTVVVPKQKNDVTVIVPPCSQAEIKQETTKAPPGSNQVVVPASALDQTVAVQPCIQGDQNSGKSNTVLLSPGGSGSPQNPGEQSSGTPQNQLLLPENANLTRIIVPPCIVIMSSSSSSSSGGATAGGTNTALPATRGKTSVTAPPCRLQMSSSSSSSG